MLSKFNDGFSLPHPLDRPGQNELFESVLNDEHQVTIVSGPVGSGKTAVIAALSQYYKLMALTFTKSLQSQYTGIYGFDPLFGLANYPCNKYAQIKYTAADCADFNEGMRGCLEKEGDVVVFNHHCPYQTAKEIAVASNRASLNVAKFLADPSIVDAANPEMIVIDEAHLLSDYLIDYAGSVLEWETDFYIVEPIEFCGIGNDSSEKAQVVLTEMFNQTLEAQPRPASNPNDYKTIKAFRRWNELMSKLGRLMNTREHYYYEATKKNFMLKPLTAEHIFRRKFLNNPDRRIILLTATPGNPEVMADSFGLEPGQWGFVQGIERFPPEDRPIKILPAPAMTGLYISRWEKNPQQKAAQIELKKSTQAKLIAQEILSYPEWYQGIIHTTSYNLADDLKQRLESYGIKTFVPSTGIGTDGQLQELLDKLDMRIDIDSGLPLYRAVISCTHGEGVDLGNLQFCMVTKIPYPYLDNYAKERKKFQPFWYLSAAAQSTQQRIGRIIRGLEEHYGPDAHKVLVICDGSYHSIDNYVTASFKDSYVKVNKHNLPRPTKGRKLVVK